MSTTINTTPIDIEITRTNNNVDVTTTPIEIEVSNADRNVSVENKPIDISIETTPIDVAVSTVGVVVEQGAEVIYWKGIITFTAGVGSNTGTIISEDSKIGIGVYCETYDKTVTIYVPQDLITIYHVTSFDIFALDSGARRISNNFNESTGQAVNPINNNYEYFLRLEKTLLSLKNGGATAYVCITFESRIP